MPDPATDYQPPFPNRVDLFVPPKRQSRGAAAEGVGSDAVMLMGFVRVDQPRAILSIDGQVASLREGDSQFGVEVISIAPPKVILQRGRQRWQTTLE